MDLYQWVLLGCSVGNEAYTDLIIEQKSIVISFIIFSKCEQLCEQQPVHFNTGSLLDNHTLLAKVVDTHGKMMKSLLKVPQNLFMTTYENSLTPQFQHLLRNQFKRKKITIITWSIWIQIFASYLLDCREKCKLLGGSYFDWYV